LPLDLCVSAPSPPHPPTCVAYVLSASAELFATCSTMKCIYTYILNYLPPVY
ncbi:hypothetical protein K523DRAFT_408503, partial [Schizophyllum commune Tattone D]